MTGPQEFLWEGTPSLTDDRSTRMFCPQKGHPHYMMTGRLTGTFCLKGHTLITWWQVARNFLFDEVYPHCVIIGPQEFFVQEGTPLSPDDRSTGFFCFQKVHPHHAMTGPPEYLHSGRSTLITWWQVRRKCLFRKVRSNHMMTGPPEFFVRKGPPSSRDDRSTGIFCSQRSALITWWGVHRKFLFQKVHPYNVMRGPPL